MPYTFKGRVNRCCLLKSVYRSNLSIIVSRKFCLNNCLIYKNIFRRFPPHGIRLVVRGFFILLNCKKFISDNMNTLAGSYEQGDVEMKEIAFLPGLPSCLVQVARF